MRQKFLSSILVVLAIAAITACGGSSSKTAQPVTVSVSPTSPQVAGGATEQFTATVANTSNSGVTWSVTGGGTINVSGLYTAPASVPTQAIVTVTATSQADSTKTGIATVTLVADSVTVSPTSGQIPAAGTAQFTAKSTNVNGAVTWSLTTGPGSINSSGLYTAPNAIPAQATITVTATLQADTAATGSTTATLLPDSVSVSANSPTVLPGQTDQFNAAVNNSALTSVTWSVTGPGTVDANGLYTAPASVPSPVQPQVKATLVSDPTQSGNATVTVLQLTALSIAPRGPTLTVGGSQNFAATGTFSDGSTSDWTPESTWTSSNTSVATVAANTATAAAAGTTNITATYGSVTGATALNVTSSTMTDANLSGPYVFFVTHAGSRGQAFSAGVFIADGSTGQITGGVEDFNAPTGTANDVAIVAGVDCGSTPPTTDSCYNVSADGRGTLHLTTASADRGTDIYSFILSSDGSHGRLILADTAGVAVGTFEKQTATTLADGTYSLLLGGVDGTQLSGNIQNPEVMAGQFTAASGTITSATTALDVNDNGAIDGLAACGATCPPPSTALQFGATYAQPTSNGRGTLVITPTSGVASTQLNSGSWNFDYFVVSGTKIVLIQSDVQGGTLPTVAALAGTAELQTFTGTPNLVASNYVFLVERSAAEGLFGSAGQWQFGASNTLTGEIDANCLQSAPTCTDTTTQTTITASPFTVGATGRGTVAISAPRSYVFYLIGDPASGTSRMYILETDNKANAGVGMQQATSLSLPAAGTTLAFDLAQLATNGSDSSFSGQLVVGAGNTLNGIADSNVSVNNVETPGANVVSGTSLAGPDGYGRGTVTLNVENVPGLGLSTGYGFYLVSPTQLVIFGTSSNQAGYQAQDGTMETQ